MQLVLSLIIAAVVIIILVIAVAFVWYEMGWQSFSGTNNSNMSWGGNGADVANMRFKGCIFTVKLPNGKTVTQNVTTVLNGMAVAYVDSPKPQSTLALVRPLNPFSFVIKGFNTPDVVPDPSVPLWANATVTLVGKVKTLSPLSL